MAPPHPLPFSYIPLLASLLPAASSPTSDWLPPRSTAPPCGLGAIHGQRDSCWLAGHLFAYSPSPDWAPTRVSHHLLPVRLRPTAARHRRLLRLRSACEGCGGGGSGAAGSYRTRRFPARHRAQCPAFEDEDAASLSASGGRGSRPGERGRGAPAAGREGRSHRCSCAGRALRSRRANGEGAVSVNRDNAAFRREE